MYNQNPVNLLIVAETCGLSPVDILGLEVLRAGVPRWHAAMRAGFRAAPKCDYICRDGHRCGHVSMVAGRKLEPPVFRCHTHMPGQPLA